MRIEKWNSIPEQFKNENTDVCENECFEGVSCNNNQIDLCHNNNNECNIILPILILLIINRYNCM